MARTGTQAVQRALALLRAVASHAPSGVTLTELAAAVGVERSTAHRLLHCLVDEGLLAFDRRSRRYRPGEGSRELGLAASRGVDLWQSASPVVFELARNTGETVFLIVRGGADTFCVGRAIGSYPIRTLAVEAGTRRPLGVGAASLAMLAALPSRDLEHALFVNASRLENFCGLSAGEVRRLVEAAKQRKFSFIDAINVRGLKAVGVAVPQVDGMPSVALSVGGIAARVSGREKYLASILHEGASAIRDALQRSAAAHL